MPVPRFYLKAQIRLQKLRWLFLILAVIALAGALYAIFQLRATEQMSMSQEPMFVLFAVSIYMNLISGWLYMVSRFQQPPLIERWPVIGPLAVYLACRRTPLRESLELDFYLFIVLFSFVPVSFFVTG